CHCRFASCETAQLLLPRGERCMDQILPIYRFSNTTNDCVSETEPQSTELRSNKHTFRNIPILLKERDVLDAVPCIRLPVPKPVGSCIDLTPLSSLTKHGAKKSGKQKGQVALRNTLSIHTFINLLA